MFIYFFPAVNWFYRLQMGLFTELFHSMGLRAVCLGFIKNLGNERVTEIVDKEKCNIEQTFFDLLYVSCVYFTS